MSGPPPRDTVHVAPKKNLNADAQLITARRRDKSNPVSRRGVDALIPTPGATVDDEEGERPRQIMPADCSTTPRWADATHSNNCMHTAEGAGRWAPPKLKE